MTSRRAFLKSSGLALLSFGAVPAALARAAAEDARRRRTLVVVFQRGACDGLNVVIPYAEDAYRKLRPSIAVPPPRNQDGALDLDGFFALHPALAPLHPLYREGSLAVVHAVGSPDPTRSHFDAQDFMESGTPGVKSTDDGFLNRALAVAPGPGSPFRGVAVSPTLPRALKGASPAVALVSVESFALRAPAAETSFEAMYAGAVRGALHGTSRDTFDAMDLLRRADPSRHRPAAGVRYPRGGYGEALSQVAQLVKSDLGLQIAFVESPGWDHHAAEGGAQGQLASRLRELGAGLFAFQQDLGSRMAEVLVVTLTEFGRTVRENGNRGTDHGHAAVSLVMGGGVAGGKVHGRWPGLSGERLHEGRDLAMTTDFRDLVGELLSRHLGVADLAKVFPGHRLAGLPGLIRA